MRAEAAATANAVAGVLDVIGTDGGRAVLVRSEPGGGAAAVVTALAAVGRTGTPPALVAIEDLDLLDEPALLALRRQARTERLVLGSTASEHAPAAAALLDYLQPAIVELGPLTLDEVAAVIEAATSQPIEDRAAAAVLGWTQGRAGDVIDVAHHLAASRSNADTDADSDSDEPVLAGFAPTADRRRSWPATDDQIARWAVATTAGVTELATPNPGPDARPIDAAAMLEALTEGQRRDAIEELLVTASALPATALDPDSTLAVGGWWCERDGDPLDAAELGHLVAAVQIAFERNRLTDALPLARRLWATTCADLAGAALATALGRAAPTAAHVALLDEVASTGSPAVLDAVLATRATWRFHGDHEGTEALATLTDRLDSPDGASEAAIDGLRGAAATLELHLGRPDDVEARLAAVDTSAAGPTSFAVNALVLADLARARHRRVIDRLDDELERRLDPGPNLSVDRYRFFRTVAAAQAGWADPASTAELDRTYRRALEVGDDWTIGWMGWGAGVQAARSGRFGVARRRLRAAGDAFGRAHRPGFAMWPAAALVELDALVVSSGPGPAEPPAADLTDHAVLADRAALELARALTLRRDGAPPSDISEQLHLAMAAARATRDIETAHLIAVERLLAGLDPDEPAGDPLADGMVVEVWPTLASGDGAAWDQAGVELIARGWPVLGVRVRAAAARRLDRTDPRATTRILQEVNDVAAHFEGSLQPWVLGLGGLADLPVLSAREREVAEAVADGASREQVAAALVVSRRTIDSHLQRVYTKLGISSRAELREWLGR